MTQEEKDIEIIEKLFPDGDETNEAADEYGFRGDYNDRGKKYDETAIRHFLAGVAFIEDFIISNIKYPDPK